MPFNFIYVTILLIIAIIRNPNQIKTMKPIKQTFWAITVLLLFSSCVTPEDGASVGVFTEANGDCEYVTLFSDLNNDGLFNDEPILDTFTICNGQDGQDGQDGVALGMAITEIDSNCRLLTFFKDLNLNGVQDENEATVTTSSICNGSNTSAINVSTSIDTDCSTGGVKYTFYNDTNNNNTLDENELVINESSVCNGTRGLTGATGINGTNGTNGTIGTNGTNGEQIGIQITDANTMQCPSAAGGLVITYFIDIDKNGIMDGAETELSPPTIECLNFVGVGIYLHENGKTLIATPETTVGESYDYGGISYMVVDNTNIKSVLTTDPSLPIVTTKISDMTELFKDNKTFNEDISTWDTSNVTNMKNMFNEADAFTGGIQSSDFPGWDLQNWDTSSVTNMEGMFNGTSNFNGAIGEWDTSSVTDMTQMFEQTKVFNQDLRWDTSSVTNMTNMFAVAQLFNGDISTWNTSSVTNMKGVFWGAYVFNQNISTWDTKNVTNMNHMFEKASVFNQDLSGWCVTNILLKPANFNSLATAWTNFTFLPVWGNCT